MIVVAVVNSNNGSRIVKVIVTVVRVVEVGIVELVVTSEMITVIRLSPCRICADIFK